MKSVTTADKEWKHKCERMAKEELDFRLIGVYEEAHCIFAGRISSAYGHLWVLDNSEIRFYAKQKQENFLPIEIK